MYCTSIQEVSVLIRSRYGYDTIFRVLVLQIQRSQQCNVKEKKRVVSGGEDGGRRERRGRGWAKADVSVVQCEVVLSKPF